MGLKQAVAEWVDDSCGGNSFNHCSVRCKGGLLLVLAALMATNLVLTCS